MLILKLNPKFSVVFNHYNKTGLLYDLKSKKKYIINEYTLYCIKNYEIFKKNNTTHLLKKLIETDILVKTEAGGLIREINIKIPLTSIQLELTKKCNLRCEHCYLEEYITQSFNIDIAKKIVDEAYEMGVINFDITGGEPFVHKDIGKLLEYISLKGMIITIFTNGTILNKNLLKTLIQSNIKKLKISLDGYNDESHDSIRGKGTFKKTVKNIKILKENEIDIEINTVIHKKNINNIRELFDFLETLEVPYHMDRYVPMNNPENDQLHVSHNEYLEAIKSYTDKYVLNSLSNENSSQYFCGAGNSYLFIRANGNVSLCPTMPEGLVAGNVLKESLNYIWLESKFFNHFRNLNCKYISSCEANMICKGGCRSRKIYTAF